MQKVEADAKPQGRTGALPLWVALLVPAVLYLVATGINYSGQVISGPDEPRYAAAARDMLRTGDWTVPRYNGEVRLEKPILIYWLCAAFSAAFGPGALACRLGPVLAGLGAVLVTAGLGSRLYGRTAGLLAGAVLASSWYFAQIGRTVLSDMPLTFFVVSAVALLRVAADRPTLRSRRWLLLAAYVCCGLAVLAKGPVGLLLPLLVVSAWLAWEGRPATLVGLFPLAGSVVAVLVAAPWYGMVWMRGGDAAAGLTEFLRHENWERYFHSFDHLDRSWKYLLNSLPEGLLPWTLLLPAGLAAFLRFGRRPAEPGRAPESTELAFPMVWACAVAGFFTGAGQLGPWPWVGLAAALLALLVVLFMLGRERYWKWAALAAFWPFAMLVGWLPAEAGGEPGGSRRAFYVLAAYPALALAAGWTLDRLRRPDACGSLARRLALAVPALLGSALSLLALAAWFDLLAPGVLPVVRVVKNIDDYQSLPGYSFWLALVGAGCLGAGLAAVVLALRGRLARAVLAAAAGTAMVQGFHWGWAIPARDRVAGLGSTYAPVAAAMADPGLQVMVFDVDATAEVVYCLDRPVLKIPAVGAGGGSGLREVMSEAPRPRYLLISADAWRPSVRLFKTRGRVLLEGIRRKQDEYVLLALDGAPGAAPTRLRHTRPPADRQGSR